MRDIKLVFLAEEDGSREQFVENATKCPEVGAEGGDTPIQHFRRDVGTGAAEGVPATAFLVRFAR